MCIMYLIVFLLMVAVYISYTVIAEEIAYYWLWRYYLLCVCAFELYFSLSGCSALQFAEKKVLQK